jgi:hypothetical protein
LTPGQSVIKIVACLRAPLAEALNGACMNFIENLFGIMPDGGSGLLEISFCLVGFFCATAVLLQRKKRKPSRNSAHT